MSNSSSPTEMQRQLQASIDASQKWQRGFFILSALWLLVVIGASWAFWTSSREFAKATESIDKLERNAKKDADAIEASKHKADELERDLVTKQTEILSKIQEIEKRMDESVLARLEKVEKGLRRLDPLVARAWVYYSKGTKPRAVNAEVQLETGKDGPYFKVTFAQPFEDNAYAAVGSSTSGYVSFSVNTPKSIDVYVHSWVDRELKQSARDFSMVVFAK
jgi:hypothetical protein